MSPNASRWIEQHAAFTPDKPALRFFRKPEAEEVWSYSDLDQRVRGWARGLKHTLGVGRGDRVAFLGYNHPDLLALLFACARLGAMLVPLNWRLAPQEHVYIVRNSGAHVLVLEADFQKHAREIEQAVPECRCVSLEFEASGWCSHESLLEGDGPDDANPNVGLDSPWLVVYTSGTTGRPKGAVLTQEALFWNALNSVHLHDLSSRDRVLSVLPFFHVGPLNIQTTPALYVGAEVVLTPRFDPGLTLKLVREVHPDLLLLVPVTMQALLLHPEWEPSDLSSLRMVVTGSSVVPADLIEGFHRHGVPVGQVYGSTETCPIAAVLRREDAWHHIGSTGKPALHCEVKIVGESGQAVPPGESGELWVRGPNVMLEYWGDAQATAEAFSEGWFRTGDVGYRDLEGFITIHDRKKDIIISGGENIYSAELEAILRDHPAVADAAVVARPDSGWGEVPVVFLECKPGKSLDTKQVMAMFQNRLARFKHPKDVIFLPALPRNTMGKVLKYELRQQAQHRAAE